MHKLYRDLAKVNLWNKRQFYLPYIITGMLSVGMFYTMISLLENQGLDTVPGASNLKIILNMGCWVIGIFVCIFLFYTNSFIIKGRKREIGIFNILGMEKRHIGKVLVLEQCLIGLLSLGGGLLSGIVFNKLLMILLYHIIGFSSSIQFYISTKGIGLSILLFTFIYLCTLFFNLMQVRLAKPVALLQGGHVGEREPKTKTLLAVIGLLCTGTGYYLAITTENPIAALQLFFVAVVLVILGTYCLFTAGSIALLKQLRKNEKYYYQTKHFISVSGMIYRMKQNAVGLANICILSTMVLVMLSTTVSMFIGVDDVLKTRFPSEITIRSDYDQKTDLSVIDQAVETTIKEQGRQVTHRSSYVSFSLYALQSGNDFDMIEDQGQFSKDQSLLIFMTKEEYESMTKKKLPDISGQQIFISGTPDYKGKALNVLGREFEVEGTYDFVNAEDEYMSSMLHSCYYLIFSGEDVLEDLYTQQKAQLGEAAVDHSYYSFYDIDGSKQQRTDCDLAVKTKLNALAETSPQFISVYGESRETERQGFYALYGGLFFLGLFLGSMFLMVTVVIIFYKQISEGYEDRERFSIMMRVGLSAKEVRASIRSQILTVFALPIVAAVIHVVAAFPMIIKLLALLNLSNTTLFIWCLMGTILVFILIYLLVFWLTSRSYYKIVRK